MTFADFTKTKEADIEDMFEQSFYLKLVNEEYKRILPASIKAADLDKNLPRIVQRLEKYFADTAPGGVTQFSHFRPARYFSEQLGKLQGSISNDVLDRFEEATKQVNGLLSSK